MSKICLKIRDIEENIYFIGNKLKPILFLSGKINTNIAEYVILDQNFVFLKG